jgi:replication factor A1
MLLRPNHALFSTLLRGLMLLEPYSSPPATSNLAPITHTPTTPTTHISQDASSRGLLGYISCTMTLSRGAVQQIFNNEELDSPVLQVIDLKTLTNGKIRTVLSDGDHFLMGMFATQLTQLVTSGEMCVNSLISLGTYSLNDMGGKKVMIVLKVNVVQKDCDKIGDPKDIVTGASSGGGSSHAPPAAQPQFQQQPKQAPPMASYGQQPAASSSKPMSQGAVQRADPGQLFQPIESLNPYQNRWTIKAKITNKGDMKTWNNARGSGQLFKIELRDEKGGEIAGCFFKDAADKFFPLLEVGNVYTFSNGRLKVANKQYNSCNSDYEITFNSDSDIRLCDQDDAIVTVYNFRGLDTLESAEPNTTCDVVGVVKRFGDVQELISKKTGNQLYKRDVFLCDASGSEVALTLWGDKAQEDEAQWSGNPVLAIKKAKISEYMSGISLGTLQTSMLTLNPEIPEKDNLMSWWHGGGATMDTKKIGGGGGGGGGMRDTSLKSRKLVSAIKDEGLGYSEKGDYITVKGTVDYIIRKENDNGGMSIPCYVSDPDTKYKCTEASDGSWFCERLDKTIQNPQRRYIMSASIKDHTGSTLATFFDDQAKQLLGGKTADELQDMLDNGQSDDVDRIFKDALFYEGLFSCRVKCETYNDEQRVKVTCNNFQNIDLQSECKQLIDAINSFN